MRTYQDVVIMLIALIRSLFSDLYHLNERIADLADDDLEVASAAAEELGVLGNRHAVPPLIEALVMMADEDPVDDPHEQAAQVDYRQDIVRALGRLGDGRARTVLEDVAVNDPDRGVRNEAVTALRGLRD
jgi:HEAT repeat protein